MADSNNDTKKPTSIAGMIFWSCLSLTMFSFCLYIIQNNLVGGIDGVMKHGLKGNGVPLATERAMYLRQGCDIRWMDAAFLQSARVTVYPLFECVDMLLLRFYGLLRMSPFLLAFILVALNEGRVGYKEKMLDSDGVSSWDFHVCKKLLLIMLGFGFIFAVFPFGLDVPLIGTIPIVIETSIYGLRPYFWVSNPFNLLVVMALPAAFFTYQISSNFSRNI